MKNKKIFRYSYSVLLFLGAFPLFSQNTGSLHKERTDSIPFFQGLYIGTDLFGPVSYTLGSDYVSYQLSVLANLNNKFFPVWEIGMGKGNTTTDFDLNLKTSNSIFNRIGLNYNIIDKKHKDFFYIGLRYGFSSFNYELNNIVLINDYWNDSYIKDLEEQSTTISWGELLAGIQVNVTSNLYMGWNVAYKLIINETLDNDNIKPWYIPGYGTSHWGITYNVYYKIPFW